METRSHDPKWEEEGTVMYYVSIKYEIFDPHPLVSKTLQLFCPLYRYKMNIIFFGKDEATHTFVL